MENSKINILVTFDKNYINPFKVMIKSLAVTNSTCKFSIWLLHSAIADKDLNLLNEYCQSLGMEFNWIKVDRDYFKNAPISKRYPQEMYYRLLSPLLLPKTLDKIIYIDPDILVLNSILPLWNLKLKENVFAASSHSGPFDVVNGVNMVRLNNDHSYFNTGVILIDLKKARKIVKADDVFECVKKEDNLLLLPDQDVFNILYGSKTTEIDDAIWNFDAKNIPVYKLKSEGSLTIDWVMKNTVFLHFCGRGKPWKSKSAKSFNILYKHYMNLAGVLKCDDLK